MHPTHLRASLLACVALACGPTSSETESGTSTSTSTTDPGTSTTDPGTSTTDPGTSTTTAPTTTSADTDKPADPCTLAPDAGNCDGAFSRYYFDPETQRCEEFLWGGCDGQVPFETVESCQSACEPCEAFAGDQPPTSSSKPRQLVLRNNSAQPIYLRSWTPDGGPVGFREQIFKLNRFDVDEALITAPNACDFPCALFDNAGCEVGCSDGGPPPPPIVIQPGGSFTTEWDGLHFGTASLPDRCLPAACEPGLQCGRWYEAWTTNYEVTAVVATTWSCAAPECTCEANGDGWCKPETADPGELVDPQEVVGHLSFLDAVAELVVE